jgi:secreted trypsin-like serine protease
LAIVLLAAVAIQAAPRPAGLKDPLTRYPIYKQLFGNDVDEYIIGGTTVTDETKHPHQVWIIMDNSYFCGGSIIAPNKVLTAAHCVDGISSFEIGAGDIDRAANAVSLNEQKRTATAANARYHPTWDPNTLLGDLAVITLTSPWTLTDYVNVIDLEPAGKVPNNHAGEEVTITGYGTTADGPLQGVSNTLQAVDGVIVITNQECALVYGAEVINDGVICLDTKNGKSSCNGDSGGPLSETKNGFREHIGIVSFGSSAGCTKGYPVGFSRTAFYREWIDANL